MRQRSGPGFATAQTNSAWSLAQRKRTRGSNRPLLEPDPTGLPAGSALIVLERGPNAGSRFLLDQPVTSVGRHPRSDIFLDDVTVSRRHAEFRWENDEFHVVDVGSLNSTYVNREPVDSAVLVNGDEVQIGKFRLTFLTKPKNHGGAGGTHDSGSTDR